MSPLVVTPMKSTTRPLQIAGHQPENQMTEGIVSATSLKAIAGKRKKPRSHKGARIKSAMPNVAISKVALTVIAASSTIQANTVKRMPAKERA